MNSLLKAAAVVAFIAAIHLGLKYIYVNVLLSQEFPIQRDRAYCDREDVRMVMVGNSLVQLDIEAIEGTYNLASFDESYSTTYYRLRDVLAQDCQPIEAVLMQLSLHSFRSIRPVDSGQVYWAQIIDYPDMIRTTRRPIPLIRDAIRFREVPYTGGVTQLLEYWHDQSPAAVDARLAYVRRDFSQATDQFTQAAAGVNRLIGTGQTIDEDTADYFSRIVDLCADHNVRLVLVRFPITRIHYEAMAGYVDMEQWQRLVDERLADAEHVDVIDFMELYFDDYSKFMDPLHLNGQSKAGFTDVLMDELKRREIFSTAHRPPPPA